MKIAASRAPKYAISEVNTAPGNNNPTDHFHVFKVNEESPLPGEKWLHPVRSGHFSIILVIEGQVNICLNLVEYTLPKKSLLIIPPVIAHEFKTRSYDCVFITLAFSLDFLGKTVLHKKHIDVFTFLSSQSDPFLLLNDEEVKTLSSIMLLLRDKYVSETEHPFKEEVIRHGISMFMFELAAIARKYSKIERVKFTRKEDLLLGFLKLLSNHFKEERSVQYYADALYITPKHLSKSIKELTNKTCGEMIDDMVIVEAKILLDNSTLSIANVADELHFSDQFFFSKFFKKHTGLNPTEYKTSM